MPGIFVTPDRRWHAVPMQGRFAVDPDVPDEYVREKLFRPMAERWVRAMEKQGYRLVSQVRLLRKEFDHLQAAESGETTLHKYQHDPTKRAKVDRVLIATFLVQAPVVTKTGPDELAALHADTLRLVK